MLVGLILLVILSRIAIDVLTEPLIETISQLAPDYLEIGLLRRLVEVIEAVATAAAAKVGAPASTLQLSERFEAVIEEGQRGLLDAARHLSRATDALGATIGSSVDALNAAINTAAVQLPPTADRGNEAFGFSELQGAVEALTTVLDRLTTVPDTMADTSLGADRAAPRKVQPHLAHELRQLLQEIEAAR